MPRCDICHKTSPYVNELLDNYKVLFSCKRWGHEYVKGDNLR